MVTKVFVLTSKFEARITQQHNLLQAKDVRTPRDQAPFRGTTRYAPLAALRQEEQSRKDDLESWFYMVVEWTASVLPWRKFKADNREEVQKMKEEIRVNEEARNTFLNHCPKREFVRIMKVTQSTQTSHNSSSISMRLIISPFPITSSSTVVYCML